MWDYVKRSNLRLIGVPEGDEENESKLENTLQDIIQENVPHLARQANISWRLDLAFFKSVIAYIA